MLSPARGITSATLYIDGVPYAMSQNGNGGSYSADTNVGFDGSQSVSVTYFGDNDTAFLKLSHCDSGQSTTGGTTTGGTDGGTTDGGTTDGGTTDGGTTDGGTTDGGTTDGGTTDGGTTGGGTTAAARPAAAPTGGGTTGGGTGGGGVIGSTTGGYGEHGRRAPVHGPPDLDPDAPGCGAPRERRIPPAPQGRRGRLAGRLEHGENGAAARPPRSSRASGGECIRRLECKNGSSRAAPDARQSASSSSSRS